MKRIIHNILLIAVMLFVVNSTNAQTPQNRTSSTVVADVLAQLPAQTPDRYNQLMSDLVKTGEEGLTQLISRIHPPGNKSNAAVDYAISGWTNFVANDNNKREMAANTFAKALSQPLHDEIKAMLIRQIELIGGEAQVAALVPFLKNETLSGPASQALAHIGSAAAKNAIMEELKQTNRPEQKLNMANAIVQSGHPEAETVFIGLLNDNPSDDLRKVIYDGLAKFGSETSLNVLRNDANRQGFAYGKENATNAYLAVVNRVSKTNPKLAGKELAGLYATAVKTKRSDLKIASAEIGLPGSTIDADKTLKQAFKDGNIAFISSVLNAYPYAQNQKSQAYIVKNLSPKASSDVNTAILYWLGHNKVESAIPQISHFVYSNDHDMQKAAVHALMQIGTQEAMLPLAGMLKSSNEKTVSLAQQALESYAGDASYTLASVYDQVDTNSKKAILQLIAKRGMKSQYNLVYNQMFTDNAEVKAEAARTLPYVASSDNMTDLFNLLEQSDAAYTADLQQALNSALSDLDAKEQLNIVSDKMKTSDKKHLYYTALANSQSEQAMNALTAAYENETGQNKKAAFTALKQWKTFNGVYPLLDIARKSKDKAEIAEAVDAIVRKVAASDHTGAVKYLYLREAMEMAQNDAQKNSILRQLGNTGMYQAMLFVAPYMDQPALSEMAAQAAMNIGIGNPEFAGSQTTQILEKASKTLTNPDAGYQRQAIAKYLSENASDNGYTSMFNGKNLDGWKGLVENPIKRAKMSKKELATAQEKANKQMAQDWKVEDGMIVFDGKGYDNLCTEKQYGDIDMLVDWKLYPGPEPDAGVYLRGTPQVQIWDTARVKVGAQVGSGGLYNNQKNPSKPLKVADQKVGEWNTFRIRMVGDRVSVWLNGELVTDNVILENFWDRSQPIFPIEQIELQAHGSKVAYRDLYIKELPRAETFTLSKEEEKEGYKVLFDGTNMHAWTGNTKDYVMEEGNMVMHPSKSFGGNLYTKEQFDNFVFRFEFMLTPGANNGLGIRTPMEGDAAYVGMELQILDDDAPIYKDLKKYQYHGSVYGVIPAQRGHLKPVGEWNYQEVVANGDHIKITLNGTVILDGNIREASKNGTIDGKAHPGLLNKSGHIAFLGHGSEVKFKNIRIKELK